MTLSEVVKERLKILVVNVHSASNAGDAALLKVTLETLKRQFPNADYQLVLNEPGSYTGPEKTIDSFMSLVRKRRTSSSPKWRVAVLLWLFIWGVVTVVLHRFTGTRFLFLLGRNQRQLLEAYVQADIVAGVGGNYLYSSGVVGLSFFIAIASIAIATCLGKPVYMMPQSIGPLRRQWETLLAKRVLKKARIVMVREENSLNQLRELGIEVSKCHLVPDLAFAFTGASPEKAKTLLGYYGVGDSRAGPLIGVTAIDWGAQNRRFHGQEHYEGALSASVADFLTYVNGTAIVFVQVIPDDLRVSRRIASLVKDSGHDVVFVESFETPELLKSVYGAMDLFIGTRLHSCIFALTQGVPVVAIAYHPKTRDVMKLLQLDHWVLDIDSVNPSDLTTKLKQLWHSRDQIISTLELEVQKLETAARDCGMLIGQDFGMLRSPSGR